MCTTAIPVASIAFTIVAPQRVQVPQVDVRITASTPSFLSLSPISALNFFELATEVPFPTVVKEVVIRASTEPPSFPSLEEHL